MVSLVFHKSKPCFSFFVIFDRLAMTEEQNISNSLLLGLFFVKIAL